MARPIRVEFPGAVYHVMARGNERREVFRDDQDRRRFLETVGEMVEEFGVLVHAYCLMPNHYHLLVETPAGNLSQALGWLQVTYTVRFNRRHRRSGHLFQGRFKAQVVEADAYAQWLVEYVHLNPVRPRRKGALIAAERAAELDRYEWSSHRDYAGLRRQSAAWLCGAWRSYWGRTVGESVTVYRGRIRAAFAKGEVASPWAELRNGLVLGGEVLWRKVQSAVGDKTGRDELTWVKQVASPDRRDRARTVSATEPDEWVKIWVRVRLGGERKADVAREFGYANGSSVWYVLRQLDQRTKREELMREKLRRLGEQFKRLKS